MTEFDKTEEVEEAQTNQALYEEGQMEEKWMQNLDMDRQVIAQALIDKGLGGRLTIFDAKFDFAWDAGSKQVARSGRLETFEAAFDRATEQAHTRF